MSATVKAEDFANYFGNVNGQTALKPALRTGQGFDLSPFSPFFLPRFWEGRACNLDFSRSLPCRVQGKSAIWIIPSNIAAGDLPEGSVRIPCKDVLCLLASACLHGQSQRPYRDREGDGDGGCLARMCPRATILRVP